MSLRGKNKKLKFALVVPTLNAEPAWQEWIRAILATGIDVADVFVVDSGSTDDTVALSKSEKFNVRIIEKDTFDHGGTRQLIVDMLTEYEFAIFLTQDALLSSPDSLNNLISPLANESVAAVCGRQLPRKQACQIESHARTYNYLAHSYTRTYEEKNTFGLKTAFISNSFAAYRLSALKEVGGFPNNIIFGEDMYVATKLLKAGYEIAYAADACVYHSHAYSLWQEMKRYFDMGVFHAREPWIRQELGSAEGEGVKFVISEFEYLLHIAFWRIPEGMVRTLLRYMGFRLGLMEKRLPLRLKKIFAMNKGYFKA